jgi:transcriptional regulator GlxA family with amidase domain
MEMQEKMISTKNIVLLVLPQVQLLDVAGPCDVFTSANLFLPDDTSELRYRVHMVSGTSDKIICSGSGIPLTCSHTINDIDFPIDTLLVAGTTLTVLDEINPGLYEYLQSLTTHAKRIGSVCVGAFVLAKAGLLNGKQVTTHWKYADLLQQTYPDLKVNVNPFLSGISRFIRQEVFPREWIWHWHYWKKILENHWPRKWPSILYCI